MSKHRKSRKINRGDGPIRLECAIKEEKALNAELTILLRKLFDRPYYKDQTSGKKSKDIQKDKDKDRRRLTPGDKARVRERIAQIVEKNNIGTPHRLIKDTKPLSAEKKSMVYMDFDAVYFIPAREDLSETYRMVREMNEAGMIGDKFSPKVFDLNRVPIWAEMKKHKSFQMMIRPITIQLSLGGFSPRDLPYLKYEDMIDLIARHSREHHDQKMIGQKQRFLKMFATCYGGDFLKNESLLGHAKEAKDFLTCISHIDKPKGCPSNVKYASEIYSVHHGINRQYAGELENPAEVNSFEHLVLTRNFPYHKVLHTPESIDLNPNIIYFGSLKKDFQIMRDPIRERQYARGEIKFSDFVKGFKMFIDYEEGRHRDDKTKKIVAKFCQDQRCKTC